MSLGSAAIRNNRSSFKTSNSESTMMSSQPDSQSKTDNEGTETKRKEVVWISSCLSVPENHDTTTGTSNNPLLPPFVSQLHSEYLVATAASLSQPTSYEGAVTEHLRMSGIYWSWTALYLLLPLSESSIVSSTPTRRAATAVECLFDAAIAGDAVKSDPVALDIEPVLASTSSKLSIIDWVWSCYIKEDGSFGGNTGHPGHVLYTLSAIQILAIATSADGCHDSRLYVQRHSILQFLVSLQQPDGSFAGDLSDSSEIDTRFTYCALSACAMLDSAMFSTDEAAKSPVGQGRIDVAAAVDYILQCRNLDGGFGSCIGAESHAGQVFCCVGALAIAESLHLLSTNDYDLLSWWLCERQVDSGGLNGRPEKQADVCYSWWILSSLSILGRVSWINVDKLAYFILQCQDDVDGGIADRPEDMADVFHTFFGIGGLSLLGHLHRGSIGDPAACRDGPPASSSSRRTLQQRQFQKIDPIYALPTDVCLRLNLPGQIASRNPNDPTVDDRLLHYKVHALSD